MIQIFKFFSFNFFSKFFTFNLVIVNCSFSFLYYKMQKTLVNVNVVDNVVSGAAVTFFLFDKLNLPDSQRKWKRSIES